MKNIVGLVLIGVIVLVGVMVLTKKDKAAGHTAQPEISGTSQVPESIAGEPVPIKPYYPEQ